MDLSSVYISETPGFIREFSNARPMQRIRDIGMNCGCEYTSLPLFCNLSVYSRFDHSLGCALILWQFTHNKEIALSGLFHDIATPCFAHVIDFLNGDYTNQESTESGTAELILQDEDFRRLSEKYGVSLEKTVNYHAYSLADNSTPHLCADRLEYSFGNIVNYGFGTVDDVKRWYRDLTVSESDSEQQEFVFNSPELAYDFAQKALQCAEVYICDNDRYAMQVLSELVQAAITAGIISYRDLWTTEPSLIEKICSDSGLALRWKSFRSLHEVRRCDINDDSGRIIYAKHRYIDPYVFRQGRVSELYPAFGEHLEAFRSRSLNYCITGK